MAAAVTSASSSPSAAVSEHGALGRCGAATVGTTSAGRSHQRLLLQVRRLVRVGEVCHRHPSGHLSSRVRLHLRLLLGHELLLNHEPAAAGSISGHAGQCYSARRHGTRQATAWRVPRTGDAAQVSFDQDCARDTKRETHSEAQRGRHAARHRAPRTVPGCHRRQGCPSPSPRLAASSCCAPPSCRRRSGSRRRSAARRSTRALVPARDAEAFPSEPRGARASTTATAACGAATPALPAATWSIDPPPPAFSAANEGAAGVTARSHRACPAPPPAPTFANLSAFAPSDDSVASSSPSAMPLKSSNTS